MHGGERLEARAAQPALSWTPLLRPFSGTHPRAAQQWIAARQAEAGGEPAVAPRRFRIGHLRLYASDLIERWTGARPFEYRNYVVI